MGIWMAPFRDGACGEPIPITAAGDPYCSHPSWSGSASRVAFTRREGRRSVLLVADVDSLGGGAARPVPLPDSLVVSYPEWSPDGRSIAFCAYVTRGSKIWIVSDSLGFAAYQDRDAPSRK
jgi:Tol biopolymer transport system component